MLAKGHKAIQTDLWHLPFDSAVRVYGEIIDLIKMTREANWGFCYWLTRWLFYPLINHLYYKMSEKRRVITVPKGQSWHLCVACFLWTLVQLAKSLTLTLLQQISHLRNWRAFFFVKNHPNNITSYLLTKQLIVSFPDVFYYLVPQLPTNSTKIRERISTIHKNTSCLAISLQSKITAFVMLLQCFTSSWIKELLSQKVVNLGQKIVRTV